MTGLFITIAGFFVLVYKSPESRLTQGYSSHA
jgi:hypothetical protein